jgi:hypothetical protein
MKILIYRWNYGIFHWLFDKGLSLLKKVLNPAKVTHQGGSGRLFFLPGSRFGSGDELKGLLQRFLVGTGGLEVNGL